MSFDAEWTVSGSQSIQPTGLFFNDYSVQNHLRPRWSSSAGDDLSIECFTSTSCKSEVDAWPSLDRSHQLTIAGQRQLIRARYSSWWPQHVLKDVLNFHNGTTISRFDIANQEGCEKTL